jgi:hypothetical protein
MVCTKPRSGTASVRKCEHLLCRPAGVTGAQHFVSYRVANTAALCSCSVRATGETAEATIGDLPGAAPDHAAANWNSDRNPTGRRTSSSLRASRRLIRFRGLRDLPRPPPCGGPCHRLLNPDGEHHLLRLTSAIGDGRRPTQLVHFITPRSPQPANLARIGVLRRHK